MKPRTCRDCKQPFEPVRQMQPRCIPCAMVKGRAMTIKNAKAKEAERRKADSIKTKARKAAAKRPSELAAEAQAEVNRYVRLRDRDKGCCSCDKPASWGGQWHCSHYIAVGASSALRFHLWNLNKSCSQCNHNKGGNIREYGLRMDQGKKEFLDNHPRGRRFTREYLVRLKGIFARRCRILEKRIAENVV